MYNRTEADMHGGDMRKSCMTMALLAACALAGSMPLLAQTSSNDQGNAATFKRGTDGEPVSGQNDTQSGPQQSSQPKDDAANGSQADTAARSDGTGGDAATFERGSDGEPVSGKTQSDGSTANQPGSSQPSPR
jgi:hypothetical protein